MDLKNVMEYSVRETLAAHRRNSHGADPVCCCRLCTADIQALALSTLPPHYVTRRASSTIDVAHGDTVRGEVARAVQRVGSRPKHQAATNGALVEEIGLVNIAFEIGFLLIEERIQGSANACECWECRCDAVAFALNRFPAQYGVAVGGRSTFPESNRRRMAEEMGTFIELGIRIVTALPRHAADC